MLSATAVDVSKEKEQSKDLISEQDDDVQVSLTSKLAESSHDNFDSESGNDSDFSDSDCSVTSGLHDHLPEENGFFSDIQAGLSNAESGETTWTDEKHSSYLDSMEATFVQKMYDKEYCSLDVCGHSSRSSLSHDQDSVESHPFYINMRKPCETKVAGLITFKGPARPLSLVPSMFTSPWIQHFKSQRNPSIQSGRNHGSAKQGADYKRQKYQHIALSQLDILMEQQYDSEQRRRMEYQKHSEVGSERSADSQQYDSEQRRTMENQKHSEVGSERSADSLSYYRKCSKGIFLSETVASLESDVLNEDLGLCTEIKPVPLIGNETCPRILDQGVPSFQSANEGACAKAESRGCCDEEGCRTATSEAGWEAECVTTRSGSKTWTWDIQGPRYHAVKQASAHVFLS